MLCFRDMTFCASDCAETSCRRHFGEDDAAAARKWWGSDDAPVAYSDFSATCPDYAPPTAPEQALIDAPKEQQP